jgi:hypothetical protein
MAITNDTKGHEREEVVGRQWAVEGKRRRENERPTVNRGEQAVLENPFKEAASPRPCIPRFQALGYQ